MYLLALGRRRDGGKGLAWVIDFPPSLDFSSSSYGELVRIDAEVREVLQG